MTDKITKALQKLSGNEKKIVGRVLKKIKTHKLESLDVKKLKGRQDIYRVRKGSIRIIFSRKGNNTKILAIERRGTNTYKNQ